jgi:hypothetical protein
VKHTSTVVPFVLAVDSHHIVILVYAPQASRRLSTSITDISSRHGLVHHEVLDEGSEARRRRASSTRLPGLLGMYRSRAGELQQSSTGHDNLAVYDVIC